MIYEWRWLNVVHCISNSLLSLTIDEARRIPFQLLSSGWIRTSPRLSRARTAPWSAFTSAYLLFWAFKITTPEPEHFFQRGTNFNGTDSFKMLEGPNVALGRPNLPCVSLLEQM